MSRWYLLLTKPREDARAQEHLLNQGYEIFRPMLRHHTLQKGVQKTLVESLFPRYIFIRLDEHASNWARLRSTRGVAALVKFNDMPAVVPDALLQELKSSVGADDILDRTSVQPELFRQGQEVEITDGSFYGLRAIVKAQSGTERVVVLLNMLGSQQALTLPIGAVRLT